MPISINNDKTMNIEEELEYYFDLLWPLNRSITGNANRKTLEILSEVSNLEVIEIPSRQKCFDWVIPAEYNVNKAYIDTENGLRIVDFEWNNLHLISYSTPINDYFTWTELEKHLHFIPEMPDAIPYKTSYYQANWGFCLSMNEFIKLDKTIRYKVVIDAEIDAAGSMTIGERIIKGKKKDEILISTYICHPSMANNELSGPLLTIFLQRLIENQKDNEYTYRFLYLPETIGSIYYLSMQGEYLKENVKAGFVVTCVGDEGMPTLKLSRKGNSLADIASTLTLNNRKIKYKLLNFFPTGSDERQYCSPYFDLPVASLMRTMYAEYPEYHTSKDNKSIMSFTAMAELLDIYCEIFYNCEKNKTFLNNNPKCEPFLNNTGLHTGVGGAKVVPIDTSAILWILNQSDGKNDLLSISVKSNISMKILFKTALLLCKNGLIKEI